MIALISASCMQCADDHVLCAQICAAARLSEDKGDGAVLQCLAENEKTASANCARETSRAVRNALSFFAPGAPITRVCDEDVAAHCASAKPIETRRIGEARPRAAPGLQGALHMASARTARLPGGLPHTWCCICRSTYVLFVCNDEALCP